MAGSQLQEVVWTGTQFVAAGLGLAGGGTFLRSTDGQTWKSGTSGGTSGSPERIAAGPNGIVAVGTLDGKTATWASVDGVHWSYHLKIFPTALGTGDVVRVTDVIATATGWLAVGRDDPICQFACGQDPRRALAWTSADGETWTRVPAQASFSKAAINAVTAVDGGYVAVGQAAGHAAFWISSDGLTWTRAADDPSFGPPPGAGSTATVDATGVASIGGTIVAVGMAFDAGAGGAPIVEAWSSSDGRSWTKASVENGEEGQVFGVAATASRFVATGPSGDTSCLGGIWTSSDGAAWACEASDPGFEGFAPYAAAGSSTVEVAVGLTSFGCGEDGCPEGSPGAIWWRPIP